MRVVLHQPEIPANTGNIGRTCAAVGAGLDLIEPLGFRLSEKELRRAGMDYWGRLDVRRHINFDAFAEEYHRECPQGRIWMATTKGGRLYTEADFRPGDALMFGRESAGIPEELLARDLDRCVRIPMGEDIRSLNLANAVAIVLYEALRQQGFPGLVERGRLRRVVCEDEKDS